MVISVRCHTLSRLLRIAWLTLKSSCLSCSDISPLFRPSCHLYKATVAEAEAKIHEMVVPTPEKTTPESRENKGGKRCCPVHSRDCRLKFGQALSCDELISQNV